MQTPEEYVVGMFGPCDKSGLYGGCSAHESVWEVGERCRWMRNFVDLIRARDAEIRADERAKVLAGFTEVYALAWDGEPSMGGEPHRVSTGAELSEPDARRALATVGRRKPNARVERRYVTAWHPVADEGGAS